MNRRSITPYLITVDEIWENKTIIYIHQSFPLKILTHFVEKPNCLGYFTLDILLSYMINYKNKYIPRIVTNSVFMALIRNVATRYVLVT